MKKKIITLLALAGVAIGAEESLTLSTVPEYNGTEGGSYAGVSFNLGAANADRFTLTGGELTSLVTLTTISLTERGNNDLDADRILYITDANNVYLGSSSVFTKETGTDIAVFNFNDSITLSTSATYYAYLCTSASDDTWTVGKTTVPAGQYYSGQLAAAGGALTSTGAAEWGLLNGQKSTAAAGYAPVMSIEVKTVPEPATATLSLLALAGLAVRRRRK